MFGNLHGWIISIGLAAMMGWLLYYVGSPHRTGPTNVATLAVAKMPIELPVAWNTVVSPGTKDGDAGDSYQKAIDDFHGDPGLYDRMYTKERLTIKESQLLAIADIVAGRDCRDFSLFGKNPPQIVNFNNTQPQIDELAKAGDICCMLGLLYTNADYAAHSKKRAVLLWESAFVLGAHLYDERLSWAELVAGHGLMQTAAKDLSRYYTEQGNQTEAEKLQKFIEAEDGYQRKLTAASNIIGGIQELPSDSYSGVGVYTGDIFQIAESRPPMQADPMFRAEAIKHVGRYQYDAVWAGDQRAAPKVLRMLTETQGLPPGVKAAVDAARDLTREKHNLIGGSQ